MSTSTRARSRGKDLTRTVAFGIVAPAFFLALAAVAQPHLAAVLHRGWLLAVAAFAAGAVTATLKYPRGLIAFFVAFIGMGAVATHASPGFTAVGLMLPVLGGYFFGLAAYSMAFQLKKAGSQASLHR